MPASQLCEERFSFLEYINFKKRSTLNIDPLMREAIEKEEAPR